MFTTASRNDLHLQYNFTNFDTTTCIPGRSYSTGTGQHTNSMSNAGGILAASGTLDPVTVSAGGTLEPGTPGGFRPPLTINGSLTFTDATSIMS